MDWFDPKGDEAAAQVQALNHSLKMGGRVLLRSASIEPWYIKHFQENGFKPRRVGSRFPGTCIDRYVHYAYMSYLHSSSTDHTKQSKHVRIDLDLYEK